MKVSSTLYLTSALDAVGGHHASAALHPPQPLPDRPSTHCTGDWVGPQGQCGQVWKILSPPGFNPWTTQPALSHYTDWAIDHQSLSKYLQKETLHIMWNFIMMYVSSFCKYFYNHWWWLLIKAETRCGIIYIIGHCRIQLWLLQFFFFYYYYYTIWMSLVRGLLFLVLLLNQQWTPPLRLQVHTAVLSVLCVMFQV